MEKVFVVNEFWDNEGSYEDWVHRNYVVGVAKTHDLAKDIVEGRKAELIEKALHDCQRVLVSEYEYKTDDMIETLRLDFCSNFNCKMAWQYCDYDTCHFYWKIDVFEVKDS